MTATRPVYDSDKQADDWPGIVSLGGPLSVRLWEIADHGWQRFVRRNSQLFPERPPRP